MKMFNTIILFSVTLLISGCSFDSINPAPKAVKVASFQKKYDNTYSFKINVKKGETLFDLINNLKVDNEKIIIINKIDNDLMFEDNLPKMNHEELTQYIKLKYGRKILVRKYGKNIFTFEEIKSKSNNNLTSIKSGSYKLPNERFEVKGSFTYGEIFNILREQDIDIKLDLKDSKNFDYSAEAEDFSGSIKSYIDMLAAAKHLFIIYKDNSIVLRDLNTVTYDLRLPKIALSPALTPGGGNTVLNGSETSNLGDGSINPLKDLKQQLDEMLTGEARYSLNTTNGTLSLTGDYNAINKADKIVQDFHDIYGKSIKLELHIYQVSLKNENSFGIDYSFLKNELLGDTVSSVVDLTTNLSKSLTLDTNGLSYNSSSGGILKTADGSAVPAQTQGLIFNYLNQFGRATVLTKPMLGTINNLPVRLDIIDTIDYVASLSQQNTATTGQTVSTNISTFTTEIKTIKTGFSLVLHPKIEGDYINIAMKSISSTLNGLIPYKYGNENENVLYLRDISAREFHETVKVKEGEIAIIGGYMYEKKHSLKNGLPFTGAEDQALDVLTSAKERSKEKIEIVITISAKVI